MKIAIIIISSLFLVACETNKVKPEIQVEYRLVTKQIPSELLEIPEYPSQPNLNGSQKDVSIWIIENEKRMRQLENQIQKIKEYNNGK